MKQQTPETSFIHLCVRGSDQIGPGVLAAAAAEVTDWDGLMELAAAHRVTAYLQLAIARHELALPASAQERLHALTVIARARAMIIDHLLKSVAGSFAQSGIPLIVLKGPSLSRTIYSPAALRTYDDLDLLVHAGDEARSVEILLRSRFEELPDEAEDDWHARAGSVEGGAPFHRRFAAPAMPAVIELHVDPLQLGLVPACEAERWQRSIPLPGVAGVWMLGTEDQLVQLSVHAHKHGYNRLIWLKDLDLLLRMVEGRIDWPLVVTIARQEGVAAAVWHTLRLVSLLFGAPVPTEASRALRPSPLIRVLYGRIWPAGSVVALRGEMHRRAIQFRPADAWRGSIPSLILMGRRLDRARAGLNATARRLAPRLARTS